MVKKKKTKRPKKIKSKFFSELEEKKQNTQQQQIQPGAKQPPQIIQTKLNSDREEAVDMRLI